MGQKRAKKASSQTCFWITCDAKTSGLSQFGACFDPLWATKRPRAGNWGQNGSKLDFLKNGPGLVKGFLNIPHIPPPPPYGTHSGHKSSNNDDNHWKPTELAHPVPTPRDINVHTPFGTSPPQRGFRGG